MQSGEKLYHNTRVYRKRRSKKTKVQDFHRTSTNDRSTRSNKVHHTDDNRQPDFFSSSSAQWGKNQHHLSSIETTGIKNPTLSAADRQAEIMNVPVGHKTGDAEPAFKNLSTDSSSFTQMQYSSKLKQKIIFQNVAFATFLTLLVITVIVTLIIIVYELSPATQSTKIDPCKSSRTITFDDIGTNPFWLGSSGYGGILPDYGGFTWLWANYLNVSVHTIFGTALVSGGYVAYIDSSIPSNILTISTNNSVRFYICSVVVASVITVQTSFTVWGILSNNTVYTVNVTINSTNPSTLDFFNQQIAVDTIEMFAYGNIFAFDNLVVSGP